MRLLLALALSLLTLSADAVAEGPGQTLHPAYQMLDEGGRSVLESGGPVSPLRTCGECHDYRFIAAHSPHSDAGAEALTEAGHAPSGRPWDVGSGLYGRWNPLTYRLLSPPGDPLVDLTTHDWVRFYGRRHVGGGPAMGPLGDEAGEGDWTASGGVEMNCFLCHIPAPDNEARVGELEAGRFRWAATATLAKTGVVSLTDDGWRWEKDAFDTDGKLRTDGLVPGDPENDVCGQCHGLVGDEPDVPLLLKGCEPGYWSTITTGQIHSPQRIADSGLNVRDKDGLERPWDVHAERLLRCVDCHHSLNNPVYGRTGPSARISHLRFDARRLSFEEYLSKPIHLLANTSGTRVPAASMKQPGPAQGCTGCHRATTTHPWLPYPERHMTMLACNACHVPSLHAPARRVVDWTVATLKGKPRTECRGVEVEDFSAHDLIDGYEPVLLPALTEEEGPSPLAPYNLISSWFWVAGNPERPVRIQDLMQALAPDGAYHPDIVSALDDDGDGVLAEAELRLENPPEVEAVRVRLVEIGLADPRIVGEIQPYPVHHGVTTGPWATRDCEDCHGSASRLARPFVLARHTPGGIVPRLVADAGTELPGRIDLDTSGRLVFAPETQRAGLYVLGHDATRWANWIGLMAVLGTLVGVGTHAGWRRRSARRRASGVDHSEADLVYMYSAYERFWHWLQALAILLLILTGLEIHMPERVTLLGFELAVRVHNVVGFVVVANALFAVLFHLASGEIQQYLPRPQGFFSAAIQQTRFYLSGIFKGEPHPFEKTPRRKLNPLQQITYLGILNVLLPLQVVTGVLIWGTQRWPAIESWLGGLPALAAVHALGAWLFAAFLVMHVYLTTTGHTPAANLRAMVMGWDFSDSGEGREEGGVQ